MLKIIAAQANNGVIGFENRLPWYCKDELEHFKRVTSGGSVAMGKRTWQSLPKKPLPRRKNYIVTKNPEPVESDEGEVEFITFDDLLSLSREEDIWVIGGEQLFADTLSYAEEVLLTTIDITVMGDKFFPDEFDIMKGREFSATAGSSDRHTVFIGSDYEQPCETSVTYEVYTRFNTLNPPDEYTQEDDNEGFGENPIREATYRVQEPAYRAQEPVNRTIHHDYTDPVTFTAPPQYMELEGVIDEDGVQWRQHEVDRNEDPIGPVRGEDDG